MPAKKVDFDQNKINLEDKTEEITLFEKVYWSCYNKINKTSSKLDYIVLYFI